MDIDIVHLQDWVSVLDDEEEDLDEDSDGSIGDWAKLETMRSSHPMHFAKKLVEVTLLIKFATQCSIRKVDRKKWNMEYHSTKLTFRLKLL